MNFSPFFRNLRSSYQAELDDMRQDSEGKDVLRQRLTQRRKEMTFLVSMMESAPEMVAMVFHDAFRFKGHAVMDHLLTQDAEAWPAWATLRDSIELAPWAEELEKVALAEPAGAWFMTVAASLEYMLHKRDTAPAILPDGDSEDDEAEAHAHDHESEADEPPDQMDSDNAHDARAREEAGGDWMVEQGFDRKD